MSTYFDLACRDCKVEMSREHGRMIRDEDALQSVVDNLKVFVDFIAASWCFDVEVHLGQGYITLGWLETHKEHRLAVKCEYESFEVLEQRLATGLTWWKRKET